ncbi:MAG: glycine cleavage system protein R [Solirubrobacteraceae bacterium]
MRHFAVSAIGRDQPGIVAGVTRSLLDHAINVEDSQMTILRGHFTMMLVVSGDDGLEAAALRASVEGAATELGLEAVSVSELDDAEPEPPVVPSHMVTVYGVDHPGIVHAFTGALAGCDVNITDLNTRLVGDPGEEDLYAMMLEVALPEGLSVAALESLLEATRREQGVDVSIRELEADAL